MAAEFVHGQARIEPGTVHGHATVARGAQAPTDPNTEATLELTQKDVIREVIATKIGDTWHYITIFVDNDLAGIPDTENGKVAERVQTAFESVLRSAKGPNESKTTSVTFDIAKGHIYFEAITPKSRSSRAKESTHKAYKTESGSLKETGHADSYAPGTVNDVDREFKKLQIILNRANLYRFQK